MKSDAWQDAKRMQIVIARPPHALTDSSGARIGSGKHCGMRNAVDTKIYSESATRPGLAHERAFRDETIREMVS